MVYRVRMPPIISVSHLSKTYASGFCALKDINLDIHRGEIFALLGPNGAGKTTLIGIICGIVNATEGKVAVDGHDIISSYRAARSMIGLVPQELSTDAFESVWATVSFSRGLFGKPANPKHIEKVLKDLSLWDKKDNQIMTLSGGMKRRVLIAKALSHEPEILFLDEPTAGVDVELRKDMWQIVRTLQASGVTIILTTHYIEEAEEMADRIGVINKGELILVEEKQELMRKLGRKQLTLYLHKSRTSLPPDLQDRGLELSSDGSELIYTYDTQAERTGITTLLKDLGAAGITFKDLTTTQSSLEDIFVNLVRTPNESSCGTGDLSVRDGAHVAHPDAEYSLAGAFDLALFRGVRGGHRLAHRRGRRHQLRRLHRARPDHAVSADPEHRQRLLRHLLPEFVGTIYELLSAPISAFEIVLGYVGAAATKSIILGLIILATAGLFVPLNIAHPFWMLAFLILTAVTFSLFGFIIGVWADSFEKLQVIPLLIITPLTFLGGSFYSVNMLPPVWQTISLFNPVVYLISGFRWSFYEVSDVSVELSLAMTLAFLGLCLATVWWIFRTGYRLKA